MGNIVLLDELTINKIAAGEVIERPASVVKELVENSIDAGATNINVEIKNGGISYIRITDNGKGILPDDMEIAFERHATSKIRNADDLEKVKSMGFRGEALASIAAIAKVEMKSKTKDLQLGYKVVVEGGQVLEKQEDGCPNGTTIIVENLFYNTPVRYKFLKKDFTEAGYIEDTITRIALINPNIAIKLINSGKTIIQTSGNGDMKSVIYSIYGKEIAENVLNVEYEYEDIKVKGVIGKPSISRSNRSNQLFFVNQRYIKDKTLTSAAEQGFKGMITIGKFGFLVLNLDIHPQKVDVNVHPGKLEVRFEEESKVFKSVYHAIKDTLLKGDLVTDTEKDYSNEDTKTSSENQEKYQESNQEHQTGLFQKIMHKKENNVPEQIEDDSSNVIAQLYNMRNNMENKLEYKSKFNNIMNQMEQMKKNAEENRLKLNEYKKEAIANEQEKNENSNDLVTNKEGIEGSLENNYEDNKMANNQEEKDSIITNEQIKNESEVIANKLEEKNEAINNNEENIETQKEQESNIDDKEATIKMQIPEKEVLSNDLGETKVITAEMKEQINNMLQETQVLETININELSKISDGSINADKIQDEEIVTRKEKLEEMPEESINRKFEEMYSAIFGTPIVENKVKEEKEEYKIENENLNFAKNISIFEEQEEFKKPTYKFIGIAFSTYIIIEIDKELYIIDQHAAHERIMYEKVKKNYYNDENKDSQMMLLPDVITLTHKEMGIAKDNIDIFRKAGFVLEEFGENTIKLVGVPNVCIDLDTKELFLETLDEINTVARTAKQEIEERFIATIACKAAVKANMALTKEEVDSLMNDLLKLVNPFTCPHGRPTAIKMTKTDIEKKFSRR